MLWRTGLCSKVVPFDRIRRPAARPPSSRASPTQPVRYSPPHTRPSQASHPRNASRTAPTPNSPSTTPTTRPYRHIWVATKAVQARLFTRLARTLTAQPGRATPPTSSQRTTHPAGYGRMGTDPLRRYGSSATHGMFDSPTVGHGCAHECEEGVGVSGAVDDFEVPGGELVERDPPFTRIEESLVGGCGPPGPVRCLCFCSRL